MTVLLQLLRGVVPVDLGDLLPGVKLTIRRLDSTELNAAREAALDAVQRIRDGGGALATYGLNVPDVFGRRLDPANTAQMMRVGHLFGAVEVAVRAVESWTGIEEEIDKKRVPAPITRETLALLLLDDAICNRILGEITAAARILVMEKKTSPALQNGSSAAAKTA